MWVTGFTLMWIIAIPVLQLTSGTQSLPLKPDAIKPENGCAYTIQVKHKPYAWPVLQFEGDTLTSPAASRLMLIEEGKSVGQPHTPHANIRSQGEGNFSHWNDTLYFSATDCSDPRINGRNYEVTIKGTLASWVKYIWLLAVCGFCARIMPISRNRINQSADFTRNMTVWCLSLIVAGVVLTARGAADIGPYLVWANYFSTYDMEIFSVFSTSVTGAPLIQWSYGTGLLAAIPAVVFSYAGAIPVPLVAIFLGLVNLALLFYISRSVTGSSEKAALCLACIVLFTPAGFYLNKYSAEGWTVLLVLSGLALMEWDKKRSVPQAGQITLLLGVVFYFLLLVKIQNIVLCLGLWLMFIAVKKSTPLISRPNLVFVLRQTLLLAAVSGIGLIFLLWYNHIVSDNFLKSPYDAGDDGFSMFSIRNLKLVEVLLSPWHGLLVYHPAIVLCVYYLVRGLKLARGSDQECRVLIISAGLVVLVLQILMQGSWFIWWMGTGTYGARGFVGASLLLAYALLKSDSLNHRPLSNLTYVSMMILGGLSAFTMSLEETNIVNFSTFLNLIQNNNWYVVFAVMAVFQIVKRKLKLERITHLTYLLLALATVPGICNGIKSNIGHIEITLIALAAAMLFSHIYLWNKACQESTAMRRLFSGVIMIIFAVSIVLQTRMLGDFSEQTSVSGQAGYSLDCREYVDSYHEYQLISGYETEKNDLYQFLQRQNCI